MRLILILTAFLAFQSAAASEFDAVRALAALGEKFCDPYEDCAEEALWDDSSQYEDTALISEADLDLMRGKSCKLPFYRINRWNFAVDFADQSTP